MQPVMRLMVEVRALTAAGSCGLTIVPLGRRSVIGRKQPPLVGMVGSVSARTAKHAAASEPDGTQLSGPFTCGLVPVEVELDVAALDRDRDLDADRLVELDAVVVEVVDEAVGALGDGAQRLAGHRLRAVQQFVEDRGQLIVRRSRRRAPPAGAPPTVQAATWALRSPITVSGMRTFWRSILISVSLKTPAVAQLQRRDAQALLVDLGRVGRHRARRHAADVLVMGHGAAERDRPCRDERPA